ncbi:MAG: flagellar basal body P-ring formation chaperone FlgA [Verrucomicrobiota bacterium]
MKTKTFLLMGFLIVGSLSAMQLELKPSAQVSASEVTLGDVVQSMEDGRQEYWNLSLGLSPALGTEKNYSIEAIERAIRGRTGQVEIHWQGPTSVRVSRPARTVMESEFRSLLTQQLEALIGEKKSAILQEVSSYSPFLVPSGDIDFQMDFAPSTNQSAWSSVLLRVMCKGDSVLTKSFRFRWSWMKTAWISTQNMSVGDLLSLNDFKAVSMDILQQPPGIYIGNILPAESTLNRSLVAGKPLMGNDFKPRIVVKRGTNVYVHYQMSGVSVSMQGVALEDGARGNLINIQNPTSHKRLLARVVDETNTVYAN